jgi:hypothetical protein
LSILKFYVSFCIVSTKKRRRRAVENRGNITAGNVFIASPPKEDGDKINIPIAVIYPSADGKMSADNIMPAQTLKQKITDSREQIDQKLQSKFSNAKVSKVKVTPVHRKSNSQPQTGPSKGTVAGVVVVVLLVTFVAIALWIYFLRYVRNNTCL